MLNAWATSADVGAAEAAATNLHKQINSSQLTLLSLSFCQWPAAAVYMASAQSRPANASKSLQQALSAESFTTLQTIQHPQHGLTPIQDWPYQPPGPSLEPENLTKV